MTPAADAATTAPSRSRAASTASGIEALRDVRPPRAHDRAWTDEAVRKLTADGNRSADTHLIKLAMPEGWPVEIYLKDESTHPTGSLKHRLARSLFLHALCNGAIHEGTTVIEASSGSTAVSEAYFARMLGLPFIAVMHRNTSPEKIALIEREGGRCHLVDDAAQVYAVSRDLAERYHGHFMDQFTYAERATDWRGNNNIAESIFGQMSMEKHPTPSWIVVGAGTGGTSATIGRYIRLKGHHSRLCVVDPQGSSFLPAFAGQPAQTSPGSRIEGIGRPRVEPSFVAGVVDRMFGVPDPASIATMRFLRSELGLGCGPSTGTAMYGVLRLACEMRAQAQGGSIVTLLCDDATRYADTYGCPDWIQRQGWQVAPYSSVVEHAWLTGEWTG